MPTNKKKPCPGGCGNLCRATATLCRPCQMKARLHEGGASNVPSRPIPPAVVMCTCGHQIVHANRAEAWLELDQHCETAH